MNDTRGRDDTKTPASPLFRSRRITTCFSYLSIGLIALLPRVLDLGRFVTLDEINFWMRRSHLFLQALEGGDYAGTAIWAQPGVTTMWLGSVGIVLRRALLEWDVVLAAPFAGELLLMRLPVALTHVAGILLGYWMLRRLLPRTMATLAVLLWATDPFLIGYNRVLHVDGLTATFTTLSLLALCCYWVQSTSSHTLTQQTGDGRLFLVASAIYAALAVLSKSPALALLPVVFVVVVAVSWQRSSSLSSFSVLNSPFCILLVWVVAFGLTLVFVWPAVWVDPVRVYELLQAGVANEGAQPHPWGNFFLGQPVDVPGPLFYPVALALRLTPWSMAGLFLLAWRAAGQAQTKRAYDSQTIAVLAGFALFFIVAMSLFPKKFNRYLIPIFPSLTILAAIGLERGMAWLAQVADRGLGIGSRGAAWRSTGLLVICSAIVITNVVWWHPYAIAYYNPLLGGARTGAQTFVTGWGEGLDQVAAWLNQQRDITGVVTASTMINSLQPLMRRGAQLVSPNGAELAPNTGYVVVYVRQTQRGPLLPPFDQFYPHATPVHTVCIHTVEYAWIYHVPSPLAYPITADFGPAVQLRGYEVDSSAVRASGTLSVTLQWQTRQPVDDDAMLFLHIFDTNGQKVGQVDIPPAGPHAPPTTWQPGRVVTWVHPVPVSADLPPGDYWLSLGLYHPDDFSRLELHGPRYPGAPDDGDHALLLPIELS